MTELAVNKADHLQVDQINGLIAAAGVDGTREIMDTFWRSTTDLLATLSSQIDEKSFDLAAATAHAIKGSAANVGAKRLAKSAALAEEACKTGANAALVNLVIAIQDDFAAVRVHFDEHLSNT